MSAASRQYLSADELSSDKTSLISVKYMNTLRFGGLPPHKLTLKLGCVVKCLRNIDKINGILKGTRVQVTKMYQYTIKEDIITEVPHHVK